MSSDTDVSRRHRRHRPPQEKQETAPPATTLSATSPHQLGVHSDQSFWENENDEMPCCGIGYPSA